MFMYLRTVLAPAPFSALPPPRFPIHCKAGAFPRIRRVLPWKLPCYLAPGFVPVFKCLSVSAIHSRQISSI